MPELTVERLFGNPPLTGRLPSQLKFAPSGDYLAYLRPADDDRERLDLWRMDLPSGAHRCWLDAGTLAGDVAALTDVEKAERERRRLFSYGITTYAISPDGKRLLLPVAGTGYVLDVETGSLTTFTPAGTRQTDFAFSPRGTFISYVRDGDLYYYDLASRTEAQVTTDGGGPIANGVADFIAQEEMHRFEGHWWNHDETRLAFTRTDESTVAVSRRYEIDADAFNVIEQRYPYAGAANARVELFVVELGTATRREVRWRHGEEDYLARVAWAGDALAVQVQSRDQRTLWLDFHHLAAGARQTQLEEQSETWINLHDNFRHLDADRFLWTSERDDASHIYLYTSGQCRRLTSPPGRVAEIVHADAERVLYSGWRDNPSEQQLFSLPLTGGEPQQLTSTPGWHEVALDERRGRFADSWTSLTHPGEVRLRPVGHPNDGILVASEAEDPDHPYAPFRSVHVTPVIGTLTAEDGQTLYYRLTEPSRSDGPGPAIVFVYGGPGVHRVKNEWAPLLLQLFAQRGFGILELDNRGSSNRGRAFEAPIHRRLGAAEVRDQLVGARFLQSLDWVSADRIGVFGHSYGGYMTLMCLTQAPEVFKAGVAVAPVSEWQLYDTHYTERYLGTPVDNPDGYQASAVFPYLHNLEGRLLIMHGMADDNVLFTHSTKLFKALQTMRYPFEMMTYPGSKHGLQEQDVAIHRFNMILDFFARSL